MVAIRNGIRSIVLKEREMSFINNDGKHIHCDATVSPVSEGSLALIRSKL